MSSDPLKSFNDPKMLELLQKINQTKAKITESDNEQEVQALKKELGSLQLHYNILSERRSIN